MTTENYFILLDLDPDKPWRQDEFERALTAKQKAWSRLLTHPSKGMRAKAYIGLIPKIKATMADEDKRAEQATKARTLLHEVEKEKREEFENTLRLIVSKGFITKSELGDLVKRYEDVCSETEIRRRIKVPVQETENARTAAKPQLDQSTAKDIASLLDQAGKEDLYDFLGGTRETRTVELQDAAAQIYRQAQLHAVKSAEVTVRSKLSGYCMDIFKTDADRARYDETFRQSIYDNLRKQLGLIGRSSREILASQVEELLRQAKSQGLNIKEARQVIKDYAQTKKWAIELPTKESVKELLVCGVCHAINDPISQFCNNCGKPLIINCPRCKKPAHSDQMACSHCGFPIGNYAYTHYLVEESKQASKVRDYKLAKDYLTRAAYAWSQELKDPLSKEIAKAFAEVKRTAREQHTILEDLRQLHKNKQYFALREEISRIRHSFPENCPDLDRYCQEAEKAIRKANSLFDRARQYETSGSGDPVPLYQDALRNCKDHHEAREMLSRTPPQSPDGLRVQIDGQMAQLRWHASASQGIQYRIVRKCRTQPLSIQDGKPLATVSGLVYNDPHPPIGLPVYYAVYADREGVISTDSAKLEKPVFLTQNVTQLIKKIGDQAVQLIWKPPPNVQRIIAVRSDSRFPNSPRAGKRLIALDNHEVIDRNVINKRTYYYTIFCEFRGPHNQQVFSSGTRIQATPQTPPTLPRLQLQAAKEGEERLVRLSWERPEKGKVTILKSDMRTLRSGSIIPDQDLKNHGTLLPAVSEHLTDHLNRLGIVNYTPIVLFQGMAYVGEAVTYTCIDDISDLHVQNLGHALRLTWNWPPDCNEAIVDIGYETWPDKSENQQVIRATLSRAEYDLKGSYDIQQPGERDHFIIVHTVINQKGQQLVSEGLSAGSRQYVALNSRITLHYQVDKPLLGRNFILKLRINGEGSLPTLWLVRKFGSLPMDIKDGEKIFKISPPQVDNKRLSFRLPKGIGRPRAFVKLFLADAQAYNRIIVRHPSQDKLRLFK